MISAREIECCAPPPVIGAESSWWLQFVADHDDELAHDDIWTVTHDDDGSAFLERAGIHAVWDRCASPPPPSGVHRLRGLLHGTVHGNGIVPDGLVAVTGRIQRVRLVSHELEQDPYGRRTLRRRPDSRSLRDVRESPPRFDHGPVGPGRQDTGVLIDLAVRAP